MKIKWSSCGYWCIGAHKDESKTSGILGVAGVSVQFWPAAQHCCGLLLFVQQSAHVLLSLSLSLCLSVSSLQSPLFRTRCTKQAALHNMFFCSRSEHMGAVWLTLPLKVQTTPRFRSNFTVGAVTPVTLSACESQVMFHKMGVCVHKHRVS